MIAKRLTWRLIGVTTLAMPDKPLTFEQALTRLEQITSAIEQGQITLEETIARHEEGMKLLEFCKKTLDEAEQRITRLSPPSATEPADKQGD